MWQEAVVAQFEALFFTVPTSTDDSHEKFHSGYLMHRLKFKPGTIGLQVKTVKGRAYLHGEVIN
jgi:hypothetical protein